MFVSMSMRRPSIGPNSTASKYIRFSRSVPDKTGRIQLTVSIPSAIVEKAKFIKGDRLDILINEADRQVLIKRINPNDNDLLTGNGWKLGQYKGCKDFKFQYSEFSGCVTVDLDYKSSVIKSAQIVSEGILINMPNSLKIK